MRIRALTLLCAAGLLALPCGRARAADADAGLADEVLLKSLHLGTDGPALLDFFRQRSNIQAPKDKLAELVKQLGDKELSTRTKAAAGLVAIGPAAIPALRQAVKDPDEGDAVALARRCLTAVEGEHSSAIPAAAARLLAQRRPDGAVDVLLAYLPFADNDDVIEEVKGALGSMAYKDGKPAPSLLKALADDSSLRRAVAIDALCAAGPAEPRETLIKLLEDKKPIVRLRAGLALAKVREEKAIDTLIALLNDLPTKYGSQAEALLITIADEETVKAKLSNTPGAKEKCRDAWAKWWKDSADPEKLVGELRKRTLKDVERDKVLELIKKLGDDDFDVRQKAQEDLQAMGPAVLYFLKKSMDDPDVEIRDRSKKLIAQLEKDKAPLSPITPRLMAFRKPKGAAEALLAFLPFADDTNRDEVQTALNMVTYVGGKPDPAVVKGLEDKAPLRRVAAAEALCRPGTAYPQAAVRKLFKDADGFVRLRAALALANVHDKEAVPVLIGLLGELPLEEGRPAEELLQRLASGRGPAETSGDDEAARKKRRDNWLAWWKDNGAKVDMAVLKAAPPRDMYLGYAVIAMNNNARVCEIGPDGKERWHIDNLQNPWDAQALPGDKVLIAEFNASQVTERNTKGEVLWQKQATNPIACQRLSNGNTFIVTRNQLIETTRDKKDVFSITRNQFDIMGAKKLKNGQIVIFSNQGNAVFMDKTGKEIKSFNIGNGGVQWGGGDVTEKGHVIVPQWQFNKVVEYNRDGKVVWEANVQWPNTVHRLPNGNTLVASQNNNKVTELDKAGKVVKERQCNGNPFRIRGR
jgi:HEAT repeat protein